MTSSVAEWRSGKTSRDENFPVASRLLAPRHRRAVLAFYRFARAADDVADHPTLGPAEKLRLLDAMEATLFGSGDAVEAMPLRDVLTRRGLSARHPCDLLKAFRLDVEKSRYASWAELMEYCALSAMPVGRFVLDVHGEPAAAWPASDALCAALQVINHVQDCGRDYRRLDRVYLPLELFEAHAAAPGDLGGSRATPALRAVLGDLVERTELLLQLGAALPSLIGDRRLAVEVDVICRLAVALTARLRCADPLRDPVHPGRVAMLAAIVSATIRGATRWR